MKAHLALFIMIDACGWEIVQQNDFLRRSAPTRKRLTSVFGYSSACIPSILSGLWPSDHRNWCYFVYDPERSPFRFLRPLRWLPRAITGRRIFRRGLTKLVKQRLNFRGYFDLYNIPFEHIALYDFTERKSPLKPGGLNRGQNICDFLQSAGIPAYISEPDQSEEANALSLLTRIAREEIDFAFLYWPKLDGLLHSVGNDSPRVTDELQRYEIAIRRAMEAAADHYETVHLYVFSDHGMANCDHHLDLRSKIRALPLQMGTDYVTVYDSTMARFWFLNQRARSEITRCLEGIPEGRVLPDSELKKLGAFFPDRYFGELIFLVKEGVLIVPSDMGERPIRAMHGYHPDEKHSYAALLTNQTAISDDVTAIPDIYHLMVREARAAHCANRPCRTATGAPRLERHNLLSQGA